MKVNKVYKEKGVAFKNLKVGTFFTDYSKQDLWFKISETQATNFSYNYKPIEVEEDNHPLFEVDVNIEWWVL